MNFDLTDEQKDIIKAAREFAEKEFPDVAQECDREEKSPKQLWEKACGLGFVGVFIPETYGGTLADFLQVLCLTEPHAKSPHDRFSVITVETDRKGFETRKCL